MPAMNETSRFEEGPADDSHAPGLSRWTVRVKHGQSKSHPS